jgi:hypothetical protein
MVVSSTHHVQLNKFNNLPKSFISPQCLCHMSMYKTFTALKSFHSSIIKSIHSYISHTHPHNSTLKSITLFISTGLCPNHISSIYSLFVIALFPFCLYFPFCFCRATIYPHFFYFCHVSSLSLPYFQLCPTLSNKHK